uniref:Uncharacterized protein n=1 Tax=Leersia perrieri TaxID=77586 RepID=A0A0D9VG87_9ORYZ
MKKATRFLKDLFSAIAAAVRARSTAVRAKTSAVRTRLIVFGIFRNRKLLLSAINRKIHALVSTSSHADYAATAAEEEEATSGGAGGEQYHLIRKAAVLNSLPSFVVEQERSAVVLLSSLPSFAMDRDAGGEAAAAEEEEQESGEKQQQQQVSVIEMARGAAEGEFRLEDEIDSVADAFIRRFHEQIKLQKLESFKRLCEMLERN